VLMRVVGSPWLLAVAGGRWNRSCRCCGMPAEPKSFWGELAAKAESLNPYEQHKIEGYKADIIGSLSTQATPPAP